MRGKKGESPIMSTCNQSTVIAIPGHMRYAQKVAIAVGRPDFPTAPAIIKNVKARAAAITNPTLRIRFMAHPESLLVILPQFSW